MNTKELNSTDPNYRVFKDISMAAVRDAPKNEHGYNMSCQSCHEHIGFWYDSPKYETTIMKVPIDLISIGMESNSTVQVQE